MQWCFFTSCSEGLYYVGLSKSQLFDWRPCEALQTQTKRFVLSLLLAHENAPCGSEVQLNAKIYWYLLCKKCNVYCWVTRLLLSSCYIHSCWTVTHRKMFYFRTSSSLKGLKITADLAEWKSFEFVHLNSECQTVEFKRCLKCLTMIIWWCCDTDYFCQCFRRWNWNTAYYVIIACVLFQ